MRYKYNTNAFEKIETEQDAYWLGFILADGYVSAEGTKPYLQIKLGEKDENHLKKYISYLGYTDEGVIKHCTGGAYTRDNPCLVVKTSCSKISENLRQYGLNGAKSKKEVPFMLNNIELEKSYIRGIIDGDGWIRENKNGMGVCGSLNVIEYIKDFIQNNIIDVSANHISKHGDIYKFEVISKTKTKAILNFLYKDATVYLDRKYKLYLDNYCRD